MRLTTRGHFSALIDGRPVFLMGDTHWDIGLALHDARIRAYLDDAQGKGFNLVAVNTGGPATIHRHAPNL